MKNVIIITELAILPRPTFSPDPAGKQNVRTLSADSTQTGNMMLKV